MEEWATPTLNDRVLRTPCPECATVVVPRTSSGMTPQHNISASTAAVPEEMCLRTALTHARKVLVRIASIL